MKKVNIFLAIVMILFLGCKHKNDTTNIHNNAKITLETDDEKEVNRKSEYDTASILETIFVTDPNGVDVKQEPDANSNTIGKLKHADRLVVIENNSGWLGIIEKVSCDNVFNGKKTKRIYMEKVYVPKSSSGKLSEIKLFNQDFEGVLIDDNSNGKNKKPVAKHYLSEYIKMEIVSKNEYLSKKKNAVDFLNKDTSKIKKINGVIELNCKNKVKRFKDNNNDPDYNNPDETKEFTYKGEFEFCNKYLVKCDYYEDGDYKLIDKINGEEMTMIDYPFISSDKKHVFCVLFDYESMYTDVMLYSITNNKIKLEASASFNNWLPELSNNEILCGNDGCYYVPALHFVASSFGSDNKTPETQYIKIRVL